MSYYRTNGLIEDISSLFSQTKSVVDKIKPVVAAAEQILADPALPEVTQQVMKLREIEKQRAKGQPSAGKPAPGIGLGRIVKPLKFFVKTREQPVYGWLIVAAIIGLPFLVGYKFGRKR